ncbi:MAG: hypothetical protein IT480_15285 [Gammaproteobacteria bacterium]|nr:hypothetical protein [Gammaproteobacteria bacterium]
MNADPAGLPASRRQLWLLVLLFFAPLLVAFWLYYGAAWRPAGRTNHGELIQPPRLLPAPAAASTAAGVRTSFSGVWSLVHVADGRCDPDCHAALLMMRQTHAALGRLQPRVQQILLSSAHCCDHDFLRREHPRLRLIDASDPADAALLAAFSHQRPQRGIFIVDPLGNLMMRYDTGLDPRGLLQDLKRLLQLSHIG